MTQPETPPGTLTDDEVRERFSAYREGELSSEETATVRARLAEDAAMRTEYERFEKLLGALGGVGERGLGSTAGGAGAKGGAGEGKVDLLAGIQGKLHKRSKGRFYKSRFSRTAGVFPLEVIAFVVLLVLVIAFVAMRVVTVSAP